MDQVLARADDGSQKFAGRPLIEASIRHALGQAYVELGQYKKAEQHAARAVKLRLDGLGPEHAETIAAQNALGWALYRLGQPEKARALLTPVLDTARKAGWDRSTWTPSRRCTTWPQPSTNPEEKRDLNEQVLAIRKRELGPGHPKTLATMNNLAGTWAAVGELEKAKLLYEETLAVELRDQPNHPTGSMAMSNLFFIYQQLGQFDRAIDMGRSLMEGRIRVLGLAHPFTQESIRRYLGVVQDQRAAQKVLEPILDRSRRELGPEAEPTIALTARLADILSVLGQTEKAIAMLDGLPENREALDVRMDLANRLYSSGHGNAALVQYQRVEALRPRLVPADDPVGLKIRADLALVLRDLGRFAEARPLLEQTATEAVRISKKRPKPDESTEEARGIAQFLLGRWPGLAPGISPAAQPPASFTIEAPFRTASPVADGRITPGEYGPGVDATFDGDTNPGRLWAWGKSRSKTPDDLSARVHTAYTDRSLFLAFQIRDQFVDAGDRVQTNPTFNDSVEVFINGDHVAKYLTRLPGMGTREGFQLVADAGGHQYTHSRDFTDSDWKVGTSCTADGYIIELEIPLALIDSRDGPEYVPATSGSELLVNFAIVDNDNALSGTHQEDYCIFWAEDPALSPYEGGEDFWTVSLRLVPKPTSSPRPAAGP